jgi:hypothetical protein
MWTQSYPSGGAGWPHSRCFLHVKRGFQLDGLQSGTCGTSANISPAVLKKFEAIEDGSPGMRAGEAAGSKSPDACSPQPIGSQTEKSQKENRPQKAMPRL